MQKIERLEKKEIRAITEAYADYPFKEGEASVFSLFGSRKKMLNYLEISIRMAVRCGWMYSIGENKEAYIAISSSSFKPPLSVLLLFPLLSLKAVGPKALSAMVKAVKRGGPSLSDRMRSEGKEFLSIEVLCVKKEYQGQGYMRKALEEVLALSDEKRLPLILETDESSKAERYMHYGFKLENVRRLTSSVALYELIYPR